MSKTNEPRPPTAPAVIPPAARVLGPERANIWKCRVVDSAGAPVHPAPGMEHLLIKGPATRKDAVVAIWLLLDCKRSDAITAGEEDPGYRMAADSLEALGHTDDAIGAFRPAGAVPINMPTDPVVRASHEKLIAERLGDVPNA